jgi:tRNA-2-methylthio-N6-dimethylallyladenosine synthase
MKSFYIETYGCQMNVADTEVVVSIMKDNGFAHTTNIGDADIILVNTCSIRENAEQRIWGRLDLFRKEKRKRPGTMVGVIGCMAERLKEKLLESDKMVDIVIGPDAYRTLPRLVTDAMEGHKAVNVLLSQEETYADIAPVRLDKNGVTAFISIMRGCNNMCSYCVVPYTRGGERSRDPESIVNEAITLFEEGYREVTLLGQNVDSYSWIDKGLKIGFSDLLAKVASVDPLLRVRFSTSHPKDLSADVLRTMAKYRNICKHIHLPVQSGSSVILELMNRKYTREWYIKRVELIREIIPDCSLSTDIITGFCNETDHDHRQSLSLMEWAGFDFSYMFAYSERSGTGASRKLKDNVPEEIKKERLKEIIALQNKLSSASKKRDIGMTFEVLIEGVSKKSESHLYGRTSQNKVVVFPAGEHKPGNYVNVKIERSTSATLIGTVI